MNNIYVVLYDISNNNRLNKAAKIVLDYGYRIQKSVYEVYLTDHLLQKLCSRLLEVINKDEDGIKIFPLCEICCCKRISIGKELPELPKIPKYLII